jgi:hypothetical protein
MLMSAGYALAQDTSILFVGNSYTHGRYPPALNYNAGPADAAGDSVVHDLLCPHAGCTTNTSASPNDLPVEGGTQVTPTMANTPGATLADKLNYLKANTSKQYNEVGPYSGVAGIFLQFTKEAGLHYNVDFVAVSSASLYGYEGPTGTSRGALSLITNPKYSDVVLQEQSFKALPTTIQNNGATVATRGSPGTPTDPGTTNTFGGGVNGLVSKIDAADAAAGKPNAAITLVEPSPIAAYAFTSSNPNAPIFGSSTPGGQTGANAVVPGPYAPYVGDTANPVAVMNSDNHNAYANEASGFNAANPSRSQLQVSFTGDAWITAINSHLAQLNPYLANEPAGQIDLWDSNPLLACCTTPIGYHPGLYGDYLDALMDFANITGVNPETLVDEWNPLSSTSAAAALGIDPQIAKELAFVAEATLRAGAPTIVTPLPSTWTMMALGLCSIAFLGYRRSRRSQTPGGMILSGQAA